MPTRYSPAALRNKQLYRERIKGKKVSELGKILTEAADLRNPRYFEFIVVPDLLSEVFGVEIE